MELNHISISESKHEEENVIIKSNTAENKIEENTYVNKSLVVDTNVLNKRESHVYDHLQRGFITRFKQYKDCIMLSLIGVLFIAVTVLAIFIGLPEEKSVHGGWSDWENWDECSVSCDAGIQSRRRTCSNPKPDRFGDHCYGNSENYRICMSRACADGGWSHWKDWEQCSAGCGGGNRRRTRACDNPAPSAFGRACIGTDLETELCNNNDCKENSVAFHVNHVSTTTNDWCIFDQVLLNEGHGYAVSSGFFKAPSPGLYLFTATMCSNNGNKHYFGIAKGNFTNYKILSSVLAYDVSTGYDCPSASALTRMEINETVAVRLTIGGNSNNYYYSAGTMIHTFIGTKISA